jgi:hypothetical protein
VTVAELRVLLDALPDDAEVIKWDDFDGIYLSGYPTVKVLYRVPFSTAAGHKGETIEDHDEDDSATSEFLALVV